MQNDVLGGERVKIRRRLKLRGEHCVQLRWSPIYDELAALLSDNTVLIYDAHSFDLLRKIVLTQNLKIHSLAWSPKHDKLAMMLSDEVQILDSITGRRVHSIPYSGTSSLEDIIEKEPLVSGYHTSASFDKRLEPFLVMSVLSSPYYKYMTLQRITDLAWSPDGRRVALSMWHGIDIIDSDRGNVTRYPRFRSIPHFELPLRGARGTLALLRSAIAMRHLDLGGEMKSGSVLKSVLQPPSARARCSWSPDGTAIADTLESDVYLWRFQKDHKLQNHVLRGHSSEVTSIAWSRDGHILVTGSEDRTIRLWSPTKGHTTEVLEGHTECIDNLLFSPDSSLLVSQSLAGHIIFWRTDNWEPVLTIESSPRTQFVGFNFDFHPYESAFAYTSLDEILIGDALSLVFQPYLRLSDM